MMLYWAGVVIKFRTNNISKMPIRSTAKCIDRGGIWIWLAYGKWKCLPGPRNGSCNIISEQKLSKCIDRPMDIRKKWGTKYPYEITKKREMLSSIHARLKKKHNTIFVHVLLSLAKSHLNPDKINGYLQPECGKISALSLYMNKYVHMIYVYVLNWELNSYSYQLMLIILEDWLTSFTRPTQ